MALLIKSDGEFEFTSAGTIESGEGIILITGPAGSDPTVEVSLNALKGQLPLQVELGSKIEVKSGWAAYVDDNEKSYATPQHQNYPGDTHVVDGTDSRDYLSGSGAARLKIVRADGDEAEFYVRMNNISFPFTFGEGAAGDEFTWKIIGENSFVFRQ